MVVSDEAKMNALVLLKKYHDHMVEINKITDLIKNYKLNFMDQSPLINQLTVLFAKDNNIYTEILMKNGVLVKINHEAESQKSSENITLINRKQTIKPEKIDETIDVDNTITTLADSFIKNSYYLEFSKQQKNKRLIYEIKEHIIKLLTYNVNEVIMIKQQIMDL